MFFEENKKSRKILVIFIFLILIFGFGRIKKEIYAPFKQVSVAEEKLSSEEINSISKTQDTDKDGISDFEERFVYQTSIYLSDTDSDGFGDQEEIAAKSDPLNGKSTPYNPTSKQAEEQSVLERTVNADEGKSFSVQEIKDLLVKQTGLSQEIVDKIDDKELERLYNETKSETGINPEQTKSESEASSQALDLDISTIRQFLIEQGVDKEMLDSIDNETLKSIFLQSLQQYGMP